MPDDLLYERLITGIIFCRKIFCRKVFGNNDLYAPAESLPSVMPAMTHLADIFPWWRFEWKGIKTHNFILLIIFQMKPAPDE